MKFRIEIREIQSDHMLASPQFLKNEYIEAPSKKAAELYILTNIKDGSGNKFKKANAERKKMFKVDFTSPTGSIVLHEHKEPKFKKI